MTITVGTKIPAVAKRVETLLFYAASLESKSEHPLAKAVMDKADNLGINVKEVSSFKALPGNGLSAELDGETLIGGSLRFIGEKTTLSDAVVSQAGSLSEQGKTPLLFVKGSEFLGIIAVADTIKEDSRQAVSELQNMGIRFCGFPCSFRSSVSPSGFMPSVYSVSKMCSIDFCSSYTFCLKRCC